MKGIHNSIVGAMDTLITQVRESLSEDSKERIRMDYLEDLFCILADSLNDSSIGEDQIETKFSLARNNYRKKI